MDKKVFIISLIILLFLIPSVMAAYATFMHNAIKISDGKDIDLNGNSIGNGSIADTTRPIYITPETYGAVGNNVTDDTAAFNSLAAICGTGGANRITMKLSEKTYNVSRTIQINCSIEGVTAETSRIRNSGTGDALDVSGAGYYTLYKNFGVVGHSGSRDGISFYNETSKQGNVAYSKLENVYSTYNGRHGFYFNQSWGLKAIGIKAHYNSGLGIFINGTNANGMKYTDSESRWNGGTAAGTTQTDDKGGVKIVSAASVIFDGGIYESNNAWAFIVTNQHGNYAKRGIKIKNIYAEANPNGANTGGFLYAIGAWNQLAVYDSYINYGCVCVNGYGFYIADAGEIGNNFKEDGNVLIGTNNATSDIAYTSVYRELPIQSTVIGDYGASGVGVNTVLLTANNSGKWSIYGLVTAKRGGSAAQGIYMFTAGYDSEGYNVNLTGTSGIESAQGRPIMTWVGNDLYLNYSAYNYGYVTISSGVEDSKPNTYTLSTTVFRGNNRRSHY